MIIFICHFEEALGILGIVRMRWDMGEILCIDWGVPGGGIIGSEKHANFEFLFFKIQMNWLVVQLFKDVLSDVDVGSWFKLAGGCDETDLDVLVEYSNEKVFLWLMWRYGLIIHKIIL